MNIRVGTSYLDLLKITKWEQSLPFLLDEQNVGPQYLEQIQGLVLWDDDTLPK